MEGVSKRMCYVSVTYVWRMKCTYDVSTAYVLHVRSILICGVSVLYRLLFNTYENKRLRSLCSIRTLQLSIIRGRRCHRRNLDNLRFTTKKKPEVCMGVCVWGWGGGGGGGASPSSPSWSYDDMNKDRGYTKRSPERHPEP